MAILHNTLKRTILALVVLNIPIYGLPAQGLSSSNGVREYESFGRNGVEVAKYINNCVFGQRYKRHFRVYVEPSEERVFSDIQFDFSTINAIDGDICLSHSYRLLPEDSALTVSFLAAQANLCDDIYAERIYSRNWSSAHGIFLIEIRDVEVIQSIFERYRLLDDGQNQTKNVIEGLVTAIGIVRSPGKLIEKGMERLASSSNGKRMILAMAAEKLADMKKNKTFEPLYGDIAASLSSRNDSPSDTPICVNPKVCI